MLLGLLFVVSSYYLQSQQLINVEFGLSSFVGNYYYYNNVDNKDFEYKSNHNWEIGGHTIDHSDLMELSYEEANNQIVNDYQFFLQEGIEINSFALPGGHASERDYDILKSIYKNIRNSIDKEMQIPIDRLDLGYYAYQTNFTPQIVKQ